MKNLLVSHKLDMCLQITDFNDRNAVEDEDKDEDKGGNRKPTRTENIGKLKIVKSKEK